MSRPSPYEVDLERNPANHAPLTPLTFIEWSASVYPDRAAVIHGARRYTWKETYARCVRLASALAKRGIGAGDTVAAMLPNTPEMYECHFGVPMAGAVLNTLNTRLDADAIAFMLNHGEAKALITDREFSGTIAGALEKVDRKPIVIDVDDPEYAGPGERLGRDRLRGVPRRGRSGVRLAAARRRVAGDFAQLHLGHDRQSEGRRLLAPRRLPERHRQPPHLEHAAAGRLPLDAADVPLQRLVLPVEHGGQRGHQRLPAQGRAGADLQPDPGAPGYALLRRADRAQRADQRGSEAAGRGSGTRCRRSSPGRLRRRR